MPEAVIVSAARSPIGRANKGSLKDLRPDDLAATIVRAALDKVPAPRPGTRSTTSTSAAACPAASRGNNMGRVVNVLNGMDDVPGATDHPLLRVVGADHPDGLPRDQGRRGRRLHLRRRRDGLAVRQGHLRPHGPDTQNPRLRRGRGAHRETRRGRQRLARPARGRRAPRRLHRDGPDRRERRPARAASTARSSTSSASARQNLAEKAIADGFWAREITPVTTPDGTVVVDRRRPPRRRDLRGGRRSSSRSSAPTASSPPATAARSTTAPPRWSSCPTPGPPSSGSPRWPGSSPPASAASPPRSWASARSRRPSARWRTPA